MQQQDLVSHPMFMFLAEEANIAWKKWDDARMENVAPATANSVMRRELQQARNVIREQFHEMDAQEEVIQRKNRNIEYYIRVLHHLRTENIRLRRLARYEGTPVGRNFPPTFRNVRARIEEEQETETEVEETDLDIANMGGQDESDEDFDITR